MVEDLLTTDVCESVLLSLILSVFVHYVNDYLAMLA